MSITVPDFGNLTSAQFGVVLLIIAGFDFVTGVAGALRSGTFTFARVLDFLDTHGVRIVAPIGALFVVGKVADLPTLSVAAAGLLALYFVQTVGSAASNLGPFTSGSPAANTVQPATPPGQG